MSEKITWSYWSKLPEVKVFEAIALLNGTEPESEPPDDASPKYRKTLRLLLACLSDRSIFTPGTLNMGDPALNGVKLAEVGRWAMVNGFVLPDKFPQSVRISKAPPPITPLSGTGHIAPDLPPKPTPNWGKWAYMRDIELWEAVALSLNLEPDQLPAYLGAFDKFGADPFSICPKPFLERLLVANSNCGISLGFKPVHELKARCLVDLPEFAAWAVKLKILNLQPELIALAATSITSPVVKAVQNSATPAPVSSVVAPDGVKEKNAEPLPLTTGDIAFCFADLRWSEKEWRRPLRDKPKWIQHCVVTPAVRGVSETRWNPVLIGATLERNGHAKQRSIRSRFLTKPQLSEWLEGWKTYEADNLSED